MSLESVSAFRNAINETEELQQAVRQAMESRDRFGAVGDGRAAWL